MRTTLDIEDDVLLAAKDLAKRQHKTAGQVISELARRALTQPSITQTSNHEAREPRAVYGFEPFAKRGGVVSNELVNKLRDQDIY
jgi:hypothetical protein